MVYIMTKKNDAFDMEMVQNHLVDLVRNSALDETMSSSRFCTVCGIHNPAVSCCDVLLEQH